MNDLDDLHRRMRISSLKARRELRDIERASLVRTIDSPRTSTHDQVQAIERCGAIASECEQIDEELRILDPNSVYV